MRIETMKRTKRGLATDFRIVADRLVDEAGRFCVSGINYNSSAEGPGLERPETAAARALRALARNLEHGGSL
jgi:hypothetical protein